MIEKKTTEEIINKFESIGHDPINEEFFNKEWLSKDSLLKLLEEDNLSYITKERLRKEIEK